MLRLSGYIDLPPGTPTAFDHGDVYQASGQVFIAHTAPGSVEILDGPGRRHGATVPGCPEASGVLCAQAAGLVFAAARGSGQVLVLDATSGAVVRTLPVGPRPNGLAWDPAHGHLLVADVQENQALLLEPAEGAGGRRPAPTALPGRPRWCVFDAPRGRFLVNIREPAAVAVLAAETAQLTACWPVAATGPHGLDIDPSGGRGFVACDGAVVVALDLATGEEVARGPIAGGPDAVWYNAQRARLYVAVATPGILDVVDTHTLAVVQRIATEPGTCTSAFDPVRQRLYLFLPQSCRVAVYDED